MVLVVCNAFSCAVHCGSQNDNCALFLYLAVSSCFFPRPITSPLGLNLESLKRLLFVIAAVADVVVVDDDDLRVVSVLGLFACFSVVFDVSFR